MLEKKGRQDTKRQGRLFLTWRLGCRALVKGLLHKHEDPSLIRNTHMENSKWGPCL